MATVDSLEIQVQSTVNEVNKSLDILVSKLGNVAKGLSSIKNNKGLEDFAKQAESMSKNMDFVSSDAKKMSQNISSSMAKAVKPMEKIQKSAKDIFAEVQERVKDIDVKVDFSNPESELNKFQKQAENAQNNLTRIMESSTADKQAKGIEKWTIALAQANNAIAQLEEHFMQLSTGKEDIEINVRLMDDKTTEDWITSIKNDLEGLDFGKLSETQIDNLKEDLQYLQSNLPNEIDLIEKITDALENVETTAEFSYRKLSDLPVEELTQRAEIIKEKIESIKNSFTSGIGNEFKLEDNEQYKQSLQELVKITDLINSKKIENIIPEESIKQINVLSEYMSSLKEKINSLFVSKGLKTYTSEYVELQNQITKTEKTLATLNAQLARSRETVKGFEGTTSYRKMQYDIKQATAELQRLRNEQDKLETSGGATQWNFKGLSDGAKSLSKTLQPLYNTLKKVSDAASKFAKKVLSIILPLKSLKKTTDGFHGSLSGGLKTILKYGVGIRSLYTLMNKLRSAVKEGMENLVQYSERTNQSVSMLNSSLTQFKNSAAAAFAPILNAIAPALNTLIQLFIRATNAVNQFFAALTGQSTWIRAKYVYEDVADSISGASKAAKGALQPFDALNNLTTQDDSGAVSPEDMFETVPIEDKFKDLADWLKDMWDKADFYDLGRKIGEELQHALANIPWDEIKGVARKLGKSLASLINGFIEVEGLGKAIGYSIAQALNTAFEFANSFVHTLHWDSIGKFIAETINGFTQNIDWSLIRDTLITGAKGLADAINSFVDYLDWDSVASTISNAVNTLSDTIIMFFERTDWSELGHKVGYTLEKAIEDIDFEDVGCAIADIIQAALDFASGVIAELDWNEIKGAIKDLFSGFFDNIQIPDNLKGILSALAGISGAVITLNGAITTAKIAKGFNEIVKAGKTLKRLGLAKIFSGIQGGFSVFSSAFGQFKNSFAISGDLFASFKNGLSTLGTGLKNFGAGLSPVTKGVIGLTAVFAEFKVVGNAFDDIINGTGSLAGSIGKITVAVGAAAAALTVVFGVPAGIIIAGVTAAVAGLKSLNDHFNELEVERVGERIKESLSNPGGVSLDSVVDQYADTFAELRGQFTNISDQASKVDLLDDSIRNAYSDIDQIVLSMDAGVASADDLGAAFERLAEVTHEKFQAINDELMTLFGTGGVYNEALENAGISASEYVTQQLKLNDETEKLINTLIEQNKTLDPTSKQYQENAAQIQALLGVQSEMTKATEDYKASLDKLDLSGIVDEQGNLTGVLSTNLETLVSGATSASSALEAGGADALSAIARQIQEAQALGDTLKESSSQQVRDIVETQNQEWINGIGNMSTEVTDAMQSKLIDGISAQITSAQEGWGKLDPLDKFWLKVSEGISSESEYVKKQLDTYKTNTIDPSAQQIEEAMVQLGIDGAGWADEASTKIYEALFSSETIYGEMGYRVKYNLSNEWQSIFEDTKNSVLPTAQETGQYIGEGIAEGLQNADMVSATQSLFNVVDQNIRSVFGIHSPAATMIPLGNNIGLGIVEGFSQGTKGITLKIQELLAKFSSIAEPLRQAGINAMKGFANGISSMAGTILSSAKSIANNVTNTIKSALSIHSPSRVMFELGDYTMQGFQNGIESLYEPIISSVKSFSDNLAFTPSMGIDRSYMDYKQVNSHITEYQPQEHYIGGQTVQSDSELKALLRQNNELLQAILEKPIIDDAMSFQSSRRGYLTEKNRQYGKSGTTLPVWG